MRAATAQHGVEHSEHDMRDGEFRTCRGHSEATLRMTVTSPLNAPRSKGLPYCSTV